MPQVKLTIDEAQLKEVESLLENVRGGMDRAIAGAINDTAKHSVSQIVKGITGKFNIKAKDVRPYVKRTFAHAGSPNATITVEQTKRLGLKYFGARQTGAGVTYQISKAGGRKTFLHAFQVATRGDTVFFRYGPKVKMTKGSHKGQMRQKIRKAEGLSPWGMFTKGGVRKETLKDTRAELHKNIDRRVRFELLKASGAIV